MKKILFLNLIIILSFSSIYSSDAQTKKQLYILLFKKPSSLGVKKTTIVSYAKMKDTAALELFVNSLCFPAAGYRTTDVEAGHWDKLRAMMADGLKYYKSFGEQKLKEHFNSIRRRIVEEERVSFIVIEAIQTLAIWTKDWSVKAKKNFAFSLQKRIHKTKREEYSMLVNIINGLKVLKTPYANRILFNMAHSGYSHRIKNRIVKALKENRR